MANLISYADIMSDRNAFLRSGGYDASEFNKFDTPGYKYFKLLFYFSNGDSDWGFDIAESSGLLAPTWLLDDKSLAENKLFQYDSAWAYLKRNCEDERANQLKEFVNLLSNINSHSPWYFSEITGLESAIERKSVMEENFQLDTKRPKISIKCLPDAADDRISTLLDLYRSIVFSWVRKCEIVPANLRKFDMGIFIYETMGEPFHFYGSTQHDNPTANATLSTGKPNLNKSADGKSNDQNYKPSCKYYELHNCEIDYTSTKSYVSSLNNKEGFNPEYTIDIHFDDCYEIRYNEFLFREIGDVIMNDIMTWETGLPNQNVNYYGPPIDSSKEEDIDESSSDDTKKEEQKIQEGEYPLYDILQVKADYYYGKTSNYFGGTYGYLKDYDVIKGKKPKARKKYRKLNAHASSYLGYLVYDEWYEDEDPEEKPKIQNLFGEDTKKEGNQNNTASGNTTTDNSKKLGRIAPQPPSNSSLAGNKKVNSTVKKQNPFVNALNQVVGTAKNYVESKIKRALLGNLYTFSLTRIGDQLKAAAAGDIWSTLRAVDEYKRDAKQRKNQVEFTNENLYEGKPVRMIPKVKKIGNIAKGKTIANNI